MTLTFPARSLLLAGIILHLDSDSLIRLGNMTGWLGKILGSPGSTSVRVGWGIYYSTFEGATDFNEIGDAPFGNLYRPESTRVSLLHLLTGLTGSFITNFFPVTQPPKNFSAKHPASGPPYDNLPEFFSAFGTISSSPAFYNGNRLPYAEEYELSVEHQFTRSDLLTVSYVGTQGHRLLSSISANPGNPSLCLFLNNKVNLAPGQTPCGPGLENNVYIHADNSFSLGTRAPFSGVALPAGTNLPCAPGCDTVLPNGDLGIIPFGNDSYFITAGASSYNSPKSTTGILAAASRRSSAIPLAKRSTTPPVTASRSIPTTIG